MPKEAATSSKTIVRALAFSYGLVMYCSNVSMMVWFQVNLVPLYNRLKVKLVSLYTSFILI